MAKKPSVGFSVQDILGEVQGMYRKDAKAQAMLQLGSAIKTGITEADGVPLREDHPLRVMAGLPCLPYNKIIQFQGDPDTGKSTMIIDAMANAQKTGHLVIIWDAEEKFDANRFATQFGGDPGEIILIRSNEILQGGEKVRKMILTAAKKYPELKMLVCWDSVGGSQSRSHAQRELDDEKNAQPGQDAKENGAVMKMFTSLFNMFPDRISILLANQVYAKIGFMQFGNQGSGGKKVEFHSSLIVQLKRLNVLTKTQKGVKVKYGITSRATLSKNHLTASESSVHQMDFEITAKGARPIDMKDADESEES
jgi:RecA/RadA recombinase